MREYLMPPLPNTLYTPRHDLLAVRRGDPEPPVLAGPARERTSRQAITQVAAALFTHGTAERVVVAGMPTLQVIGTGGDVYASERQQWDSGNNAIALEPRGGLHLRPHHPDQHPAARCRWP